MATLLKSRILPTDHSGAFLLLCGLSSRHPLWLDHVDTRYALATHAHMAHSERVDLLTGLTIPRPPSETRSESHHQLARTQLEFAESGHYGPEGSRHYRDNYRRLSYAAEMALTRQVWMPSNVLTSRNFTAVAVLPTGSLSRPDLEECSVVVRAVDCRSGEVLIEECYEGLKDGLATHEYQLWTQHEFALSADGSSLLTWNYEVSRDGDGARWLEERSVARDFPVACRSQPGPPAWFLHLADGGDRWVVCTAVDERKARISVLEKGTLVSGSAIELSRHPAAVAPISGTDRVVCGFFGGSVWVVDAGSGKIRKFNTHIGAGKDDWVAVHVADDGTCFVSECNGQVVLTNLENGSSAVVGTLNKTRMDTEPFDGVDTSVTVLPAVALIGEALAVAEGREVRELPRDTDDYDHCFVSEAGRPGARKPVRVSRKAPLDESIERARLGARKDAILAATSPAVTIATKKLGKRGWARPGMQHAPELGTSRFGGWPDLPAGAAWPAWRGRPMAFLGQIDLAEARAAVANSLLPEDGLLLFFLGCTADRFRPDGDPREQYLVDILLDAETDEANGWHVEYVPADTNIERRSCGAEPLPQLFHPCRLRFKAGGLSLPDEMSAPFARLKLDNDARADYLEMVAQLQKPAWAHQLMGYPAVIQSTPPEYYCEAGGFDFPPESDEQYSPFVTKASEWRLLLQLVSDPGPDFMWGDGGHFYFYVRDDALRRRDFSDTRVFYEN